MQYTLVGNEDGSANLTVFVEGNPPLTAHSSHPNYDAILAGVMANDESVYALFDVALTAATKFERLTERISVANGRLYLDGEEVHNTLAEQVIRFLKEGVEDWKPLVNFFENVQANPNDHSREQLYRWIEASELTITNTGMIVGYKGVNSDGKGSYESVNGGTAIVNDEVFTGLIPNPVGAIVEMPRSEVKHDPNADCRVGLHVGTHSYASTFASFLLEVEVNPRDVVSVPNHDGNKMRVCRYKVVKVLSKGEKCQTALKPEKAKRFDSLREKKAVAPKAGKTAAEPRPIKVGDVYEDTDKRRAGRTFKVTSIGTDGSATGKSMPLGLTRTIAAERLQSRKYKLVKKGR